MCCLVLWGVCTVFGFLEEIACVACSKPLGENLWWPERASCPSFHRCCFCPLMALPRRRRAMLHTQTLGWGEVPLRLVGYRVVQAVSSAMSLRGLRWAIKVSAGGLCEGWVWGGGRLWKTSVHWDFHKGIRGSLCTHPVQL